jgi:prefoldin subunit 5
MRRKNFWRARNGAIELQRFVVDRLLTNEQLSDEEGPRLLERRSNLRRELDANSEVLEAIRSTTAVFDREITALEARRDELIDREKGLTRREGQLSLVLSELDGEEDILTANVQATDLLRQFCGRVDCQMFASSERSFGRSLLFLKDQIKDLKSSDRDLSNDLESIGKRVGALNEELVSKRVEREQAVHFSPQAELMGKLRAMTKEVMEVELRLAKLQQYEAERQNFERLLDQREQASAAVAASRLVGVRGASAVGDARQLLSDAMQQWLTVLGTQNTKSAHFDEDFVLYIDGASLP